MEQGRNELALGWLGWVLVTKLQAHFVHPAIPVGAVLAGNAGLPTHQVGRSVPLGHGAGVETKWVIPSPVFALLRGFGRTHCFSVRSNMPAEDESCNGWGSEQMETRTMKPLMYVATPRRGFRYMAGTHLTVRCPHSRPVASTRSRPSRTYTCLHSFPGPLTSARRPRAIPADMPSFCSWVWFPELFFVAKQGTMDAEGSSGHWDARAGKSVPGASQSWEGASDLPMHACYVARLCKFTY